MSKNNNLNYLINEHGYDSWPYKLTVFVNEASNLNISALTTKDPYYSVEVYGKLVGRSKTLKRTSNPKWTEKIVVNLLHIDCGVSITVFDENIESDDTKIGTIKHHIHDLESGKEITCTKTLTLPGSVQDRGTITYTLKVEKNQRIFRVKSLVPDEKHQQLQMRQLSSQDLSAVADEVVPKHYLDIIRKYTSIFDGDVILIDPHCMVDLRRELLILGVFGRRISDEHSELLYYRAPVLRPYPGLCRSTLLDGNTLKYEKTLPTVSTEGYPIIVDYDEGSFVIKVSSRIMMWRWILALKALLGSAYTNDSENDKIYLGTSEIIAKVGKGGGSSGKTKYSGFCSIIPSKNLVRCKPNQSKSESIDIVIGSLKRIIIGYDFQNPTSFVLNVDILRASIERPLDSSHTLTRNFSEYSLSVKAPLHAPITSLPISDNQENVSLQLLLSKEDIERENCHGLTFMLQLPDKKTVSKFIPYSKCFPKSLISVHNNPITHKLDEFGKEDSYRDVALSIDQFTKYRITLKSGPTLSSNTKKNFSSVDSKKVSTTSVILASLYFASASGDRIVGRQKEPAYTRPIQVNWQGELDIPVDSHLLTAEYIRLDFSLVDPKTPSQPTVQIGCILISVEEISRYIETDLPCLLVTCKQQNGITRWKPAVDSNEQPYDTNIVVVGVKKVEEPVDSDVQVTAEVCLKATWFRLDSFSTLWPAEVVRAKMEGSPKSSSSSSDVERLYVRGEPDALVLVYEDYTQGRDIIRDAATCAGTFKENVTSAISAMVKPSKNLLSRIRKKLSNDNLSSSHIHSSNSLTSDGMIPPKADLHSPNDTRILCFCQERRDMGSEIMVPWSQVVLVEVVTPSVLLVNIAVHKYLGYSTEDKQDMYDVSVTVMSVFILGCPAEDQCRMFEARREVRSFRELVIDATLESKRTFSETAAVSSKSDTHIEMSLSSLAPDSGVLYDALAALDNRISDLKELGPKAAEMNDVEFMDNFYSLQLSNLVACKLELFKTVLANVPEEYIKDIIAAYASSETAASASIEQTPSPGKAISDLTLNWSHLRRQLEADTLNIKNLVSAQVGHSVSPYSRIPYQDVDILLRFTEAILSTFLARIKMLSLFDWRGYRQEEREECLSELISAYFNVFVSLFGKYFDCNDRFQLIKGMRDKCRMITCFVACRSRFEEIMNILSASANISVSPSPSLGLVFDVSRLTTRMTAMIDGDMRDWVDRTVQYWRTPEARSSEYSDTLPWCPFENPGVRSVFHTSIPEDIRTALTQYLSEVKGSSHTLLSSVSLSSTWKILELKLLLAFVSSFISLATRVYGEELDQSTKMFHSEEGTDTEKDDYIPWLCSVVNDCHRVAEWDMDVLVPRQPYSGPLDSADGKTISTFSETLDNHINELGVAFMSISTLALNQLTAIASRCFCSLLHSDLLHLWAVNIGSSQSPFVKVIREIRADGILVFYNSALSSYWYPKLVTQLADRLVLIYLSFLRNLKRAKVNGSLTIGALSGGGSSSTASRMDGKEVSALVGRVVGSIVGKTETGDAAAGESESGPDDAVVNQIKADCEACIELIQSAVKPEKVSLVKTHLQRLVDVVVLIREGIRTPAFIECMQGLLEEAKRHPNDAEALATFVETVLALRADGGLLKMSSVDERDDDEEATNRLLYESFTTAPVQAIRNIGRNLREQKLRVKKANRSGMTTLLRGAQLVKEEKTSNEIAETRLLFSDYSNTYLVFGDDPVTAKLDMEKIVLKYPIMNGIFENLQNQRLPANLRLKSVNAIAQDLSDMTVLVKGVRLTCLPMLSLLGRESKFFRLTNEENIIHVSSHKTESEPCWDDNVFEVPMCNYFMYELVCSVYYHRMLTTHELIGTVTLPLAGLEHHYSTFEAELTIPDTASDKVKAAVKIVKPKICLLMSLK